MLSSSSAAAAQQTFFRPSLDVWRAPLMPVALAFSAGIVLDRLAEVAPILSLGGGAACLVCWVKSGWGQRPFPSLLFLWGGVLALGALYHQTRTTLADNDIAHVTGEDVRVAAVRGQIHAEPIMAPESPPEPLRSYPRRVVMHFVLAARYGLPQKFCYT